MLLKLLNVQVDQSVGSWPVKSSCLWRTVLDLQHYLDGGLFRLVWQGEYTPTSVEVLPHIISDLFK